MPSILKPSDRLKNGHRGREALTIKVSRGTGEGRTRLSAFDAALRSAGVSDFNLIRLSSVIPNGSEVQEVGARDQLTGPFGAALYCVYAVGWASTPHSEAWAGVAWSRSLDGSGGGLFVEHSGMSLADVQHDLTVSLDDLSIHRGGGFEPEGQVLTSIRCTDRPVCAIVVATYRWQDWGEL
jgi:arginine decarboxylase